MSLPGFPYDGDDPEGFVPRDEIVRYLERYAASFGAPVREGIEVNSLESEQREFLLKTSAGEFRARHVVLTTGAYQKPFRPRLKPTIRRTSWSSTPRNTGTLAPCLRAECWSLAAARLAARSPKRFMKPDARFSLACGRTSWLPRRVDGRDIVTWLNETTFFDTPLSALPSPLARLTGNPQLTGRGGGHDLHYRTLQKNGVQLLGRLVGIDRKSARFAPDLAASVAFGDERYVEVCNVLREQFPAKGIRTPVMPTLPPFQADPPLELELDGFGAVIFTSGFRPDYTSWVKLPAFDEMGFPIARDGASAVALGLYFVGVHFLRKRKSSLMFGVGEDAAIVAQTLAQRIGARA